jgi:hypothetical protein
MLLPDPLLEEVYSGQQSGPAANLNVDDKNKLGSAFLGQLCVWGGVCELAWVWYMKENNHNKIEE